MKYQALRLFLWRWHRRLGLGAAVLLIWLSVSGVLLNHTSYFNLASTKLPVSLADSVYPVEYTQVQILETQLGSIKQLGRALYLDGQPIQNCEANFIGAVALGQELWLACTNQILVLGNELRLLETLDKYSGLKVPISKIASCNNSVCVESNQQVFIVDIATARWHPYHAAVNWVSAKSTDQTVPQLIPDIHNWERFILEAHSGRLFGSFGVLIMDLAALAMVLLALSGCYVWWSHYRRRKLAVKRADRTETLSE